ncbi:helix-turn-helix domain-containing protein [Candidatus Aquicultor secundus]|nr:helix-turn-helix domain-containing protein [Candidatus Aquicultor secundus]
MSAKPEEKMKGRSAEIMTTKQLADYLQMSQITICRLAREKKLPGLKIGKEWRFPKELIDRFIASGSNFDEVFEGLEASGGDRG